MNEMYRSTSFEQKLTIGGLALTGVVLNITTDWRVSSIVYTGSLAFCAFAFALFYNLRSDWHLTPAGRAQFLVQLSLGALAAWILTGLVWHDWPWRNEVRDWLFLLFALAGANQLYVLLSVQHRELDLPPEDPEA